MTKLVKFFQQEAKYFAKANFKDKAFVTAIYLLCLFLGSLVVFFISMVLFAMWMFITKATSVFLIAAGIIFGIFCILFAFNTYGKRLLKKPKKEITVYTFDTDNIEYDWDFDPLTHPPLAAEENLSDDLID